MKRFVPTVVAALLMLLAGTLPAGAFKVDGINYSVSGKNEVVIVAPSSSTKYTDEIVIPDEVQNGKTTYRVTGFNSTSAGFAGSNVTKVVFGKYITSIPQATFQNCKKLVTVKLNEGITTIGVNAFNNCPLLYGIKLPSTLKEIGQGAFKNCTSLDSISIPPLDPHETSGTWGQNCFQGCTGLKYVVINSAPGSNTTVRQEAFMDCPNIETVCLGPQIKTFEPRCFGFGKNSKCVRFYFTGKTPPARGSNDFTSKTSGVGTTPTQIQVHVMPDLTDAELAVWNSWIRAPYVGSAVPDKATGVGSVAGGEENAPAEYFTIDGRRVNAENPAPGIYVERRGTKVRKVYIPR